MDPLFVTEEEIHLIHRDQLERYGGSSGLRDPGLLESALAQPSASFDGRWLYEDLFQMAAAYLFSLVMNHPFVDGNKRVGGMAALAFLQMNDILVEAEESAFADLVIAVASGSATREDVAHFLRIHSRPLEG
jgi:death-on-curing protein